MTELEAKVRQICRRGGIEGQRAAKEWFETRFSAKMLDYGAITGTASAIRLQPLGLHRHRLERSEKGAEALCAC